MRGKTSTSPYITRISSPDFKGYRVHFWPDWTRYFSLLQYENSWEQCAKAACAVRDEEATRRYGENWQEAWANPYRPDATLAPHNTTGKIGVSQQNIAGKGMQIVGQWQVWENGRRKTKRKQFAVAKYGYDQAVELAAQARERGLIEEDLKQKGEKRLPKELPKLP